MVASPDCCIPDADELAIEFNMPSLATARVVMIVIRGRGLAFTGKFVRVFRFGGKELNPATRGLELLGCGTESYNPPNLKTRSLAEINDRQFFPTIDNYIRHA